MFRITLFKDAATFLLVTGIIALGASQGKAQLVVTDIDGTAIDPLYTYIEGETADILAIPDVAPVFWFITTPTPNTLVFDTQIGVGFATAEIVLTGLESNTDWLSASITGTNGIPDLTYSGGDTASIDFETGGGEWFGGDTITITFEAAPVPEPSTTLGMLGLAATTCFRRRHRAEQV